jgi:tetratricopeptide (TPR) repeat protein
MSVDAHHFLKVTEQPLRQGDATELAEVVRRRWSVRELCKLLEHAEANVRRVAAVTLGLVGDCSVVSCLVRALHDADEQVNEMAEHGLLAIWFRCCSCQAAGPFQAGVDRLSEERYEQAVEAFNRAIELDPEFAEAYNQRGLAYLFLGQLEQAISDYKTALAFMPSHFPAMEGLGHAYTHLDQLPQAYQCYRQALTINPRLEGVRSALQRIEQKLGSSAGAEDEVLTRVRW